MKSDLWPRDLQLNLSSASYKSISKLIYNITINLKFSLASLSLWHQNLKLLPVEIKLFQWKVTKMENQELKGLKVQLFFSWCKWIFLCLNSMFHIFCTKKPKTISFNDAKFSCIWIGSWKPWNWLCMLTEGEILTFLFRSSWEYLTADRCCKQSLTFTKAINNWRNFEKCYNYKKKVSLSGDRIELYNLQHIFHISLVEKTLLQIFYFLCFNSESRSLPPNSLIKK